MFISILVDTCMLLVLGAIKLFRSIVIDACMLFGANPRIHHSEALHAQMLFDALNVQKQVEAQVERLISANESSPTTEF